MTARRSPTTATGGSCFVKTWLPILALVTLVALVVYALNNNFVILGMQFPLTSFFFLWFVGYWSASGSWATTSSTGTTISTRSPKTIC